MSAISNLPDNKNFLSPLGFRFIIHKTPNVNYFVQSANLPNVQLGTAAIPSPFVTIPTPGDHLSYGDLIVTFRVDEDMVNYKELYTWMTQLGFPDSFDQYSSQTNTDLVSGPNPPKKVFSDASLIVLSSAMNPVMEITYKDLFPISLSDVNFDTRNTQVAYVDVMAVFRYRTFTLTPL